MTEHLAHQVLEAVLVGVGAREPRRDLGAVDRRRHHPEGLVQHGEIEPREMKNLEQARGRRAAADIGRAAGVRRDLHHVGGSVAGRELDQAQPVAAEIEPHGFGVDRDRAAV